MVKRYVGIGCFDYFGREATVKRLQAIVSSVVQTYWDACAAEMILGYPVLLPTVDRIAETFGLLDVPAGLIYDDRKTAPSATKMLAKGMMAPLVNDLPVLPPFGIVPINKGHEPQLMSDFPKPGDMNWIDEDPPLEKYCGLTFTERKALMENPTS